MSLTPHNPGLIAVPPNAPVDFDSYALHDPEYSVNEFYLSATEGGFSAKLPRASVPPAIAAQINEIVQDRRLPYRTSEALIRDAVYHRLHWLAEEYRMPPELHTDLAMWAHTEKILASQARLDANKAMVDALDSATAQAQRESNYAELARLVDAAADAADTAQEHQAGQIRGIVDRYRPAVERWRKGLGE